MKHFAYIFLFALLSLACVDKKKASLSEAISGKVIGIKDGDTIEILYNGKPLTIRLAHIDCPEIKRSQPFGRAAKEYVSDQCFGHLVKIQHNNEYDRSKRLIGEVINEKGINVNKALVSVGLAWHYKKYSTDSDYAKLEMSARMQGIGVWSEPAPVAPWDWRKPAAKNVGKTN